MLLFRRVINSRVGILPTFMSVNTPPLSVIRRSVSAQKRDRRASTRALKRRHDALITRLARSVSPATISAELFTGIEGFVLLAGHLVGAKLVANRVARRAVLQTGRPLPSPSATARQAVPRPKRIVAEAARPGVLPGLVDEHPDNRLLSVEAAILEAMTSVEAGQTAFRILDCFRSTTALNWEAAAAMLLNAGVISDRLDDVTISMAANARRFWDRWQLARDGYRAAFHLGQVKPAEGEWGLIDADEIEQILPGFPVPKSAIRAFWLVRMIRKSPSSLLDLDFHAASGRPLFTLPP